MLSRKEECPLSNLHASHSVGGVEPFHMPDPLVHLTLFSLVVHVLDARDALQVHRKELGPAERALHQAAPCAATCPGTCCTSDSVMCSV